MEVSEYEHKNRKACMKFAVYSVYQAFVRTKPKIPQGNTPISKKLSIDILMEAIQPVIFEEDDCEYRDLLVLPQ